MGAPRFVQPRPASPGSSDGTLALWLGIGSIVMCLISLGLLALPALLCAIGAVVLGVRARRRGGGRGGIVTGAIGIAVSLLALVFWIALVILGGLSLEFLDFWDAIEEWLDIPPVEDPVNPDAPII